MQKKIIIFFLLILTAIFIFAVAEKSFAQVPVPGSGNATSGVSTAAASVKPLDQKVLKKKVYETVFVICVGYLFMFLMISFINKRVMDLRAKHNVRKNIVYFVSLAIIVIVFFIWIQNLNSITIFLGVASAGIALALQEVLLSMAGWLLILVRRPFEVGDRIELDGIKGDIIDIRLFQTSMLEIGNWVDADQSTGRIVNIPNSAVFKSANYNYSRGFEFIWNEIPVMVTFESDWKKGQEIMLGIANRLAQDNEDRMKRKIDALSNRYMIFYGKTTPIVYVNIKDSGVELTLRYLCEAKKRRSTQDQLCQAILNAFDQEPTVNFAYTTYRIVKE